MLDEHDDKTRRCPPLGGPVPFKYCRTVNAKLPCRRILECWGAKFDVVGWLEENYTDDEIRRAMTPDARSRLDKILRAAYEAQKRGPGKGGDS